VEFRHVVRASQRAVLAAEALVVEVLDDPRDRVFLVGIHGAGAQAGRLQAVMTRRGHVLEHRQVRRPADEQADLPPGLAAVVEALLKAGAKPPETISGSEAVKLVFDSSFSDLLLA
jgi:hypothetical protein